jgi:hypothetical protein
MKLLTTILGAILILIGGTFILQGINVLPGSFMTGHMEWAGWGSLIALAGLAVLFWGRRKR